MDSGQRGIVWRLLAPEDLRPLTVFKFAADRLPVAIFLSLTALDFVMFFMVESTWLILAYWVAMIPVKAMVCAWNHHHQHVPTFHAKPLNRLLEMSFALHTGATTNAWVLHHVHGHHMNYLDQDSDESRWRRTSGETFGYIHYTLITTLTAYTRAFAVGRNHPRLQRAFIGYGLLTLCIVGALVAIKPFHGLFLFAFPMITSLVITIAATYHHHSNLDTDDHMQASRNYTHNIRNVLSGNLGYHTAHHYRQGLHWSKLPELHAEIVNDIPAEYIKS